MVSVYPAQWCTSLRGGRARWVGGRRWALLRRRQSSGKVSFYFPCVFFFGGGEREKFYSFFQGMVLFVHALLILLVAHWEPMLP